ncbi:hypothetical protein [Pseudophaeobacter sp.]|uniref:tetratricopeptide repeat protein n=1 Tax=Pseudophaeobacter sp. TaxID=1971739 RepID=UPI00263A22DF|nr:hypothetical protein [Pseudophaeobacter sp.]
MMQRLSFVALSLMFSAAATAGQAFTGLDEWAEQEALVEDVLYRACNDGSASATEALKQLILLEEPVALSKLGWVVGSCGLFPQYSDEDITRLAGISAQEGYPWGMYQYGRSLLWGSGITQDTGQGVEYLEQAGAAGFGTAYLELVFAFINGLDLDPDLPRARRYLEAAINSNTVADFQIERTRKALLEAEANSPKGDIAAQTPEKPDTLIPYWQEQRDAVNAGFDSLCSGDSAAFAEYDRLLRDGNPVAMYNIWYVQSECGLYQDLSEIDIKQYWKRSSDLGYPLAQFAHGTDLLVGRGFAKDVDASIALLERAGEGRYGTAYARLARFFAEGRWVGQDVPRAEAYLQRAYATNAHPEEITKAEEWIAKAGGRIGPTQEVEPQAIDVVTASSGDVTLDPVTRSTNWPKRPALELMDLAAVSNGTTPVLNVEQAAAFRRFLSAP